MAENPRQDIFLSKLNPATRAKVIAANEISSDKLALPSLGLTKALSGGVYYKSQTMLWGNKSGGKGGPLDTVIPTPGGKKRWGDLTPGDQVFGANGQPVEVVAIHPLGVVQQYVVTFNDGTAVRCNPEHLWTIQTHKQKYGVGRNGKPLSGNYRTVTTQWLKDNGQAKTYPDRISSDPNFSYKVFVPTPSPVEYSKKDLTIEPYLLGLMLGDGYLGGDSTEITMNDEDAIIEACRRSDVDIREIKRPVSTPRHWRVFKMRHITRALGVDKTSHFKRVPTIYLESSINDRLWLLRGLLDSDGSMELGRNRAAFHSCNAGLAEDVAELVRSLGGVARVDFKPRTDKTDEYEVQIWTPQNPFHISRKAERYNPRFEWFKAIKSIEEIEPTEMMCITVDNPDGLYLTNDYIVTHNSSLALGMLAQAQRDGRTCAWIDAENSYRPGWATSLGVDETNLHVLSLSTIDDCYQAGTDLLQAEVDVLVIDSISPLLPQSYFDDGELKGLGGTNKIGSFSQDLQKMLAAFNYANRCTALVLISQIRNSFGSMHASLVPMGGKGTEHMNSVSIKLAASPASGEQIKGKIYSGDRVFEQNIGRRVTWLIDKDRGPGMMMSGEYDFYYKGSQVGIDAVKEIVAMGIEYGIIEKAGNWLTVYGERFNGTPKTAEYVRENPEVQDKLYQEILSV